MTGTTPNGGHNALAIYLNDHLAGATAGVELAHRGASAHRSSARGATFDRLAAEIAEDRAALVGIMQRLGVRPNRVKVVAGWAAEKVSRLKLNGRLLSRSPLSDVIEVEAMRLGVEGKAAGWRALRAVAEVDDRINPAALDTLIERAERQSDELEGLRVQAAAAVFVAGAPRASAQGV